MDREELTDRENQRRWGEGEKSDVDAQTAKRRRKENGSNSEVVEEENFRNKETRNFIISRIVPCKTSKELAIGNNKQ